MGRVLDLLQNGQSLEDAQQTFITALEMIAIAIGSGTFSILVGICASKLTSTMMSRVRYDLFSKINNISLNELNKFSVSSLVTRTTNDITQVTTTFNLGFRYVVYAPILVFGAITFMIIQQSWELTLVVICAVLLLVAIVVMLVKFVIPKYRTIQEKTDKVNLATRESLEGLRVIRAYDAEQYQEEKFKKINDDLCKTTKFSNRFLGFVTPSMQLIMGLVSLMMAWLGSYLVNDGRLVYSEIAVFTQYSQLLLLGFLMISMILVNSPRSIVSAKRIFQVIETESSIVDSNDEPEIKEEGTIEFKNVSFVYPGAEKPVLDDISFTVKKGETIAFIGATGSGKSTLINLIPRFFDCSTGEVLVDGVNVKNYKLDDLYKKIGYVPQKGYLFHDSLKNNVCLGKPEATDEEFKRALDISESADFVSKLTNGENYEISQGGKNVSGGQRQRLSIARAIIMNPEFFIFDDSFSALDYRTDKILRGKIKNQCPGITNVIVAQRVGTIIDADQIIVLDEGKIVGHGKHDELMKNCPVYIEIASSQLGKEGN
jgi:ATP-binding cassette subfamily B protein